VLIASRNLTNDHDRPAIGTRFVMQKHALEILSPRFRPNLPHVSSVPKVPPVERITSAVRNRHLVSRITQPVEAVALCNLNGKLVSELFWAGEAEPGCNRNFGSRIS
jgi:hypothetical protein